jgi:hypothetical protein
MSPIILTEEQTRMISEGRVPVCDPRGNLVGHIEPVGFTPEEIAEAKRRTASAGPWYTGEQVRAHLSALEEAAQREGTLEKARMRTLLEEIRSRKH